MNKEIYKNNKPIYGVFAIAGSPKNNKINKLANIKWEDIDGDWISQICNFPVILLNDFEAVGYSIYSLEKED